MRLLKLISLIILLLLFFVTLQYGFTTVHEDIHIQIAKYHNCNNYTINNNILKGDFVCYSYDNRTEEMRLQELKLHSWNEILGYYLNYFVAIFLVYIWIRIVK